MMTRSRKASLRQNGRFMYNLTLKFAVGQDEIAAVIYKTWFAGENCTPVELPTDRMQIWKAVEDSYSEQGSPSTGVWDYATDEQIKQAYELSDKLFPELKQ